MCSTTMQLGSLTIDAPAASVRVQAELLAMSNPDDPRLVLVRTLIDAVQTHNANARAAIEMFTELAKYERHEGYAYVRATLDELNQRNDVARARLIKPYADFLSAADECVTKGYITRDEYAALRSYAPGGLAADPLTLTIVLAAIIIAIAVAIVAWNVTVPRSVRDVALATTTLRVGEESLAILRDSAATPEQQKAAKSLLEKIVRQPGGPLAPAATGFGVGLIIAGVVGLALFNRSNRRTA